MKLLVGKTFGIGNLVMAVPMLKALRSLKPEKLDLLIGSLPDDTGAWNVANELQQAGIIDEIFINGVFGPNSVEYDYAIMAIPFDGRWQNGVHFKAKNVLDGRTRPDPSTTGLVSWEKHEILYQMENADRLGYKYGVPSPMFLKPGNRKDNWIYLGLGYKKDAAGFWKFKHWGNENYAELIKLLCKHDFYVVTTGDILDLKMTINPIQQMTNGALGYVPTHSISKAFDLIRECSLYVGNDTGMMHVAASCDALTLGIMMDPKLAIKNPPFTPSRRHGRVMFGWNGVSPENVFIELLDLIKDSKCT